MFNKQRILPNIIRTLSIALFMVALTQPCFDTENAPGDTGQGAALVISGFFGFFSSAAGLTWLANPALWFAWVVIARKPGRSLYAGAMAMAMALGFLLCKDVMINEAGGVSNITNIRIGYSLWVGSIAVMLLGCVLLKFICRVDSPGKKSFRPEEYEE